jgi:hypothetical protein
MPDLGDLHPYNLRAGKHFPLAGWRLTLARRLVFWGDDGEIYIYSPVGTSINTVSTPNSAAAVDGNRKKAFYSCHTPK